MLDIFLSEKRSKILPRVKTMYRILRLILIHLHQNACVKWRRIKENLKQISFHVATLKLSNELTEW